MIAYHEILIPDSLSGAELDQRLAMGWYRMHQTIFTTTHLAYEEFYRVHWLRYRVPEISDRTTHRRIRNRNKGFTVTIEDVTYIRADHEELYARYRASINFDGAMSIQQSLIGEEGVYKSIFSTKCISVYDRDKLVAGGYFDLGDDSSASILHFFDPEYKRNSLGKYLMLLTTDYLKAYGYEFYYPGYVLSGNPKMNYKLFIGKEAVEYWDAETSGWRRFKDGILLPEELSERDKLEVLIALLV